MASRSAARTTDPQIRAPQLRRATAAVAFLAILATLLGACATVPVTEHEAVVAELAESIAKTDALSAELAAREARIASLESELADTTEELARTRAESGELQSDLDVVLNQLGLLREQRLDLQDQIADLERRIEGIGTAAAAAQRAEEAVAAAESASRLSDLDAPDALAAAMQGGSGFVRVSNLALVDDTRARNRLAIDSPGIGVDMSRATPLLFDTRLNYDETEVYLTILDPEGRRPRLELTAQYVTNVEPLYLRTAFISIEGGDPVDPIDPIVLAGEPVRQTDGVILREAITIDADRALINRLSTIVSSVGFRVTFAGLDRQVTHRPTVAERAALSNILFAYFDLGAVR